MCALEAVKGQSGDQHHIWFMGKEPGIKTRIAIATGIFS